MVPPLFWWGETIGSLYSPHCAANLNFVIPDCPGDHLRRLEW